MAPKLSPKQIAVLCALVASDGIATYATLVLVADARAVAALKQRGCLTVTGQLPALVSITGQGTDELLAVLALSTGRGAIAAALNRKPTADGVARVARKVARSAP